MNRATASLGLQEEMPDAMWQDELDKDRLICIEKLAVVSTTATLSHCFTTSLAYILLHLDDDAVPCFGWLEAHVSAFAADPRLAYAAGREVRV